MSSISISDSLIILATIVGPITAVQAQKWIEQTQEQKRRRLWIFQTLMATRAVRAGSNEHVQALNLIDVFFNGKSTTDKSVRTAWAVYLDFLMQDVPKGMSQVEHTAYNERGVDLLVTLLETISSSLGYDFNKVQLKRGGYFPQGHADDNDARISIRDNLVQVLSGQRPIPMSVINFPVSEAAVLSQQKVHEALLKTLSGDKPLKVDKGPS